MACKTKSKNLLEGQLVNIKDEDDIEPIWYTGIIKHKNIQRRQFTISLIGWKQKKHHKKINFSEQNKYIFPINSKIFYWNPYLIPGDRISFNVFADNWKDAVIVKKYYFRKYYYGIKIEDFNHKNFDNLEESICEFNKIFDRLKNLTIKRLIEHFDKNYRNLYYFVPYDSNNICEASLHNSSRSLCTAKMQRKFIENRESKVSKLGSILFDKLDDGDITFRCNDKKLIKAHKIVLSTCNWFSALINGSFKESKSDDIDLDIDSNILIIIIEYIYKNTLQLDNYDIETIFKLYETSKFYLMEELMKKVELEIINKINYDNFFFIIIEGWKNEIDLVIEKCTELYMKNYNILKNHDHHTILKSDNDLMFHLMNECFEKYKYTTFG